MNKSVVVLFALATAIFSTWSFGQQKESQETKIAKAVAVLQPSSNSKVSGVITFAQKNGSVEITGEVRGLTPGLHGFHIHQYGDISAMDGKSAGGHFNPTGAPHGGPDHDKRHVGDLGNIKADESGKAVIKMHDKLIQLHGEHSIVGRALVVHAKADDLKSQPSGDAGDRVAFGVVGIANSDPAK